jgi:uncharacterized protein YciI
MVIIELIYKKSLEDVEQFLKEHRDFLQKYYDKGLLLTSGPKKPRDGGIIIAFSDKKTIESVIQSDPFYREGIAEYRIFEFEPVKYDPEFKKIYDNRPYDLSILP